MTPKKTILQALLQEQESNGDQTFIRPSEINGFSGDPGKYQKAVNELLKDRLIDGMKDQEGKMAVALNAQNLPRVKKELRPPWARPAIWAMATVVLAAVLGLVGL